MLKLNGHSERASRRLLWPLLLLVPPTIIIVAALLLPLVALVRPVEIHGPGWVFVADCGTLPDPSIFPEGISFNRGPAGDTHFDILYVRAGQRLFSTGFYWKNRPR